MYFVFEKPYVQNIQSNRPTQREKKLGMVRKSLNFHLISVMRAHLQHKETDEIQGPNLVTLTRTVSSGNLLFPTLTKYRSLLQQMELLGNQLFNYYQRVSDTWRIKSARMIFLLKKLGRMLADKSSKFILHKRFQPQNNTNNPSIEAWVRACESIKRIILNLESTAKLINLKFPATITSPMLISENTHVTSSISCKRTWCLNCATSVSKNRVPFD